MGIVNRTPDSFYDGGRLDLDECADLAARLWLEQADVIDLGAVSAGPGEEVGERAEIDRLVPLVEAVAARVPIPISVETARARVAELALAAGASIVNDVSGLSDPELARVCARSRAAIVLMHNGGQIRGVPQRPRYDDVVEAVIWRWQELSEKALSSGVPRDAIVVDPGIDFGKTTLHSLELIRRMDELVTVSWPVLVAPSRKDLIGESLDLAVHERLEGTLALVALAVLKGAAGVRVHDVEACSRVVRMVETVMGRRPPAAPRRGLHEAGLEGVGPTSERAD